MNEVIEQKYKKFSDVYDLGSLDLSKYYNGRTSFQLENFVMKEHDLPERQFLQLIMELKSLRDGFIIDSLEMEKIKIEIKRLLDSEDDINQIEALKKQYILSTMEENMEYRNREIKTLARLIKSFPKLYTYDEIESAESKYWEKRLTRQVCEDMMSAQTGINPGNIRSSIQAGTSMDISFRQFQNQLSQQIYSQKNQLINE